MLIVLYSCLSLLPALWGAERGGRARQRLSFALRDSFVAFADSTRQLPAVALHRQPGPLTKAERLFFLRASPEAVSLCRCSCRRITLAGRETCMSQHVRAGQPFPQEVGNSDKTLFNSGRQDFSARTDCRSRYPAMLSPHTKGRGGTQLDRNPGKMLQKGPEMALMIWLLVLLVGTKLLTAKKQRRLGTCPISHTGRELLSSIDRQAKAEEPYVTWALCCGTPSRLARHLKQKPVPARLTRHHRSHAPPPALSLAAELEWVNIFSP
ncbi:hypothetical protein XA68_16497 [Ophiocordyceps unilateralis]|uniref:Uncharacterized protein n=1 Tax=Ophiocordyceps unilateralis TaxID=268505 RepID=A0A2A9P5H2_OPHUN|nr:hypothetical protein XA68_16497 [Ophiocordyceps unilateralis]